MPDRGRRLLTAQEEAAKRWVRNRHRYVSYGSALLAGILVYIVVPTWLHGATRFVAAYDAAILTLLWFFWRRGLHANPQLTRARAAVEDPGRNIILLLVLGAVLVGLVAAGAILGHGPRVENTTERWEAYFLGLTAVTSGWVLVQTVFTFRYAHLYWYGGDRAGAACGGIVFPGTDEPSDYDFAYLSFAVGTSCAVSDPQITETRVRKEVITHSIVAFAYNSAIIGIVINMFAGIFSSGSH